MKSGNSCIKGDAKARLKAKDIACALKEDSELRGIIPDELVVKFHGQSSGVKRGAPAGGKKEPAKKRARKH